MSRPTAHRRPAESCAPRRPGLSLRPVVWRAVVALTGLSACGEGDAGASGGAQSPRADARASPDAGDAVSVDAEPGDATTPEDATPDDATPADATTACTADEACGEGAFCEAGACLPAVPLYAGPADGVMRLGVARFDVAPGYFETWTDRAGPECPSNRAGAFDGPLAIDGPPPEDPCVDTFDDADGDGRFDAVWMAGAGSDRPATGIDESNPPAGRVLVLQQNDQVWLLVTLDLYAVGHEPLLTLSRGLQLRLGIPEVRIAVHVNGTRTAPDAVGMWGPSLALAGGALAELSTRTADAPLLAHVPISPGLDREWWREVRRRVAVAARQAMGNVVPVTLRRARATVVAPTAGDLPPEVATGWSGTAAEISARLVEPSWLSQDLRFPRQRDAFVRLLAFDGPDGLPVALLGAWGAAPFVKAGEGRLSADLTGLLRAGLEARFPGALALWLTGASSEEVRVGPATWVPETDADGRPLDAAAWSTPAADPPAALTRLLLGAATTALAEATPAAPVLNVQARYTWLPVTNPRYGLAARLGIVPGLADWLAGRRTTPAWSSGVTTPACGGQGCLRYRLDRVDLGPLTLVTTPGGLDEAFVQGRAAATLQLTDTESRNLEDLDLDGVPDADDPEIVLAPRAGSFDPVRIDAPLNPQEFAAVEGLEGPDVWLLGRTNGGLGSLRPASDVVNVFEGQMRPLETLLAEAPALGAQNLCLADFPCEYPTSLATLLPIVAADLPGVLTDLPGGHLLRISPAPPAGAAEAPVFRIEDVDGTTRVEAGALQLGPGPYAFALGVDFGAAGVRPGDVLVLRDGVRHVVEEVVPLVLARHPNAGDPWRAPHLHGGDAVYNTACELLYGGTCPHPRPPPGAGDPDATLPRLPDAASPPSAPPSGSNDRRPANRW
ncbi:hypothetical protein L6V77_31105 [Myxococcota bacterium]|nr:hypothetical protein [Myxococcota bacterium]